MARAKSTEQGRIKPKPPAVDEINRGIEKLKDLMAQIEDLSREGFPYRDAVRARTELSLRETIRRIFGEKSEEYQTHKTHKLRTGHRAESAPTIAAVKHLIAQLEQQKSELLGVKSPAVEPLLEATARTDTSLPTISRPDTLRPAGNESAGRTTQPTDSAKGLAAASAIRPSTAQSVQPAAEGPPVESLCATNVSHQSASQPISPSAEMATVNASTSSDRSHTPRPESNRVEVTSAADPVAPQAPAAREPAELEPSISNLTASVAAPAETGVTCAGSPALAVTQAGVSPVVETAPLSSPSSLEITPSTIPLAFVGTNPAPMVIPVDVRSNEPPATFHSHPTSEVRHRPATTPPVRPLPSAPRSTNENSVGMPVLAGESPPAAESSSADMTTRSQQAARHAADPVVAVSERTRASIEAVFHLDDPMTELRKVCTRFHLVARQLRLRRDYRATLEVEDEYDVQDLLYALLRLAFEEVGTEDWCPAYEDGATRTSYLLHKERIVIIAKKTKTGLATKELAEQIKIDSRHYSGRADCRTLVCFIYDPEGRVGNPRGLESDLTMVSDAFTLEVIIAPK
jgi:hypothetical protein